jgi:hypothetical protein
MPVFLVTIELKNNWYIMAYLTRFVYPHDSVGRINMESPDFMLALQKRWHSITCEDGRKRRKGTTMSFEAVMSFLERFAPARCWGCAVALTWTCRRGSDGLPLYCNRLYAFSLIDSQVAHSADNVRVVCRACSLFKLGLGPKKCKHAGCHGGRPRGEILTDSSAKALNDFHVNPEPELSNVLAWGGSLADLLGIDRGLPYYRILTECEYKITYIEMAFAVRHNCWLNLFASNSGRVASFLTQCPTKGLGQKSVGALTKQRKCAQQPRLREERKREVKNEVKNEINWDDIDITIPENPIRHLIRALKLEADKNVIRDDDPIWAELGLY